LRVKVLRNKFKLKNIFANIYSFINIMGTNYLKLVLLVIAILFNITLIFNQLIG